MLTDRKQAEDAADTQDTARVSSRPTSDGYNGAQETEDVLSLTLAG